MPIAWYLYFCGDGSLNKKMAVKIEKLSTGQTFNWLCLKNSVHDIYFLILESQAQSVPRLGLVLHTRLTLWAGAQTGSKNVLSADGLSSLQTKNFPPYRNDIIRLECII